MDKTYKPPDDTVPSRLYKYRCWTDESGNVIDHSRRMLSHNAVFFASARTFNDPFDCKIPVEIEKVSDSFVRKRMVYLLKEEYPSISDKELRKRVEFEMSQRSWEDLDKLQHWHKVYQESKYEQGVLSVSEPRDNLLMWSHYADSHKGFCVGFDTKRLEAFFNQLANHDHIAVVTRKVAYVLDYPTLNFFKLDDPSLYAEPLSIKSSDWEYEQEYRFIRMNKANIQFGLDTGIIVEVIFGCEMPDEHKREIKDVLREKGSKVELFEARKKDKSFGLDFIRIDY